jgi:hypothetical protein
MPSEDGLGSQDHWNRHPQGELAEIHVRMSIHDMARPAALTRAQLVNRILELNPSASHSFLVEFTEEALLEYLDHLTIAHEPRGRGWIRRGEMPAIVAREAQL